MNIDDKEEAFFPACLVLSPCYDWASYKASLLADLELVRLFDFPSSSGNATVGIWLESWDERSKSIIAASRRAYLISGVDRNQLKKIEQNLPSPFFEPHKLVVNHFHPGIISDFLRPISEERANNRSGSRAALLINKNMKVMGRLVGLEEAFSTIEFEGALCWRRECPQLFQMIDFYSCCGLMDCYRESFKEDGSTPQQIRNAMGLISVEKHSNITRFIGMHQQTVSRCVEMFLSAEKGIVDYDNIVRIAAAVAVSSDQGRSAGEIVDAAKEIISLNPSFPGALGTLLLSRVVDLKQGDFSR